MELSTEARKNRGILISLGLSLCVSGHPGVESKRGQTCGSGMRGRGPWGGAGENITTEVEVMLGKEPSWNSLGCK